MRTISHLKKQIPCKDRSRCEEGRNCPFSHQHRYEKVEPKTKTIPCVHYIGNRCDNNDENCRFSHDKVHMSDRQKQSFKESRGEHLLVEDDDGDISVQEISRESFRSRASSNRSGSHPQKRRRYEHDYTGSSCDTDKFPEPVSSTKVNRRHTFQARSNSSRDSGYNNRSENSHGAPRQRSPMGAPSRSQGSPPPRRPHTGSHSGMSRRGRSHERPRKYEDKRNSWRN